MVEFFYIVHEKALSTKKKKNLLTATWESWN